MRLILNDQWHCCMSSSPYFVRNKPVLFFYSSLLHCLWFYKPFASLQHFSKPRSSLFHFLHFMEVLLNLWSSLPLVCLSSLFFQDEVIRTTQRLQSKGAQRFLQWNNEVCILFSTISLRFPDNHFVFLTTTHYDPMFSENYPVSPESLSWRLPAL